MTSENMPKLLSLVISRSQALPGNAVRSALPPLYNKQIKSVTADLGAHPPLPTFATRRLTLEKQNSVGCVPEERTLANIAIFTLGSDTLVGMIAYSTRSRRRAGARKARSRA
jgi:hypothetical protein